MCEVAWCDDAKQLIRRQGPFTQESSQRHLSKQADIEKGFQQKKSDNGKDASKNNGLASMSLV